MTPPPRIVDDRPQSKQRPDARRSLLGSWPYVDIVVVKDYEQSPIGAKEGATCYVRIHMDIELDEKDADKVDEFLKKNDKKGAYDKIRKSNNRPSDAIGLATLKAALSQLSPSAYEDPELRTVIKEAAGGAEKAGADLR